MNNLINTLYHLAKGLFEVFGKGFDALSKWFGKMWWFVVAFIMTPITWIIDFVTESITWITEQVSWLQGQLEALGFSDIGESFSSFGVYLGLLDNFVPVGFMFFVAGVLLGLWIVCTLIRIIIRCIPTAG